MSGPAQAMGSASKSRTTWPLLVLFLACGAPPPEVGPPPAAPAGSNPASDAEFTGVPWSSVELESLPARLSLPEARAWHARRSGTFIELEHAPTDSTLVLRVWRAARLVRPEECEAEARLARSSLPAVEPSLRIDERRLDAPADFDVRLVVGAEPGPRGSVRGSALAVGAGVGRCYLASFETRAEGARAAERVADRLDAMVRGCFETVELESADRRVPPPTGVK